MRPLAAVFAGVWAGLVACVLVVMFASPASAHAVLVSSQPGHDQVVSGPPQRVVLTFNEPVEIAFGALRVFDTDGERVDEGETTHVSGRADEIQVPLQAGLADGTYTVTWRVISADSHPVGGAFVFHLGAPGARPAGIAEPPAADLGAGGVTGFVFGVARWVNYAVLLLLVGAAVFAVVVWHRPFGGVAVQRPPLVEERFGRRWRWVMVAGWGVAVAVTLVMLVFQGAVASGVSLGDALSADVVAGVVTTRFGQVTLVKVGLLAAVAGLWALAKHSGGPLPVPQATASLGAAARQRPTSVWVLACLGLIAVGLLASPGLAGHAGTTSPIPVNIAADVIHMVAAAAWIGGLVMLLAVAFPAARDLAGPDRVTVLAPVVARFSALAVISVAALVVTGTWRAWIEIQAWQGLTGTTYGRIFAVKIAVFALLLAFGFVNNRWTTPRLQQAAHDRRSTRALPALRRLVGVEVTLAAVVLAVTAVLVNLPPARVDATASGPPTTDVTRPRITDTKLGANNLNVVLDPGRVGRNEIRLTATTPRGTPAEIEGLTVRFRMPAHEIGPLVGKATKTGPGHFTVEGRQLSIPGTWVLDIEARVDKFTNAHAQLKVTVNR